MSVIDLSSFRERREAANGKDKMSILRSRAAVSASLASVVVLATIGNFFLFSTGMQPQDLVQDNRGRNLRSVDRGIASIEVTDSGETKGWFRELLESRSQKIYEARKVASVGQKASLMDQLRFGDLEGKYAVRVEEGALREINFVDSESSQDRPKYLVSTHDFLSRYQALHKVKFDEVINSRVAQLGTTKVEVFELRSGGATTGLVEVTRDSAGRLIQLRIEEVLH